MWCFHSLIFVFAWRRPNFTFCGWRTVTLIFWGLTCHSLNQVDVTGVTLLQIDSADGSKTFFRLGPPPPRSFSFSRLKLHGFQSRTALLAVSVSDREIKCHDVQMGSQFETINKGIRFLKVL